MSDAIDGRPHEVGVDPGRLERIDGWMRDLVAQGKLAGLSVSVARRGRTVFRR
ncbi:serine hydrolase, partial [Methylobacterium sp. WL122]